MSDGAGERVSIFVDVQNVYYTCRQAFQGNFDYNRFFDEVTSNRELVKACAYATDVGDEKQKQFQNILRGIGFTVYLKPMLKRVDGTKKADWDVGIALDAYEEAQKCDTVVLASGDGDFTILLQRIRERFGTRSEVYGVTELTSNSLIQAADKFTAIDQRLLLTK